MENEKQYQRATTAIEYNKNAVPKSSKQQAAFSIKKTLCANILVCTHI
jgi:diacylglycerol kinase